MSGKGRRGDGHLYQRGDVWWIAFYVDGKLTRESAHTTVEREAAALLRARLGALDRGETADTAAMRTTLGDLRDFVANDYANNELKTGRNVKSAYDRLAEFFGGGETDAAREHGFAHLARKIDAAAVEEYKTWRRAKRKGQPKGRANATCNGELAHLRRGLRLAVRFGKLTVPPSFALLRPAPPRKGFLDVEQFEAVAAHLTPDIAPLATFMYWTGWRTDEVKKLEWRQVDRRAGVIRIDTSKNTEARTVPYKVLPALDAVIESQWKRTKEVEQRKRCIVARVFHRQGKAVTDFRNGWDAACIKAGLPGRLPHDTRRSAARNMVRAGIPQAVAMQIGGWKTDSIFKRYAIVDEKMLAEGMKKLRGLRSAR